MITKFNDIRDMYEEALDMCEQEAECLDEVQIEFMKNVEEHIAYKYPDSIEFEAASIPPRCDWEDIFDELYESFGPQDTCWSVGSDYCNSFFAYNDRQYYDLKDSLTNLDYVLDECENLADMEIYQSINDIADEIRTYIKLSNDYTSKAYMESKIFQEKWNSYYTNRLQAEKGYSRHRYCHYR